MFLLNQLLGRQPQLAVAHVEIYTWTLCPYCIRAKLLLWWKRVHFIEYKIDGDQAARAAMTTRARGQHTVPQIFINGQHIGGCDDLYALERTAALDPLLAQQHP